MGIIVVASKVYLPLLHKLKYVAELFLEVIHYILELDLLAIHTTELNV